MTVDAPADSVAVGAPADGVAVGVPADGVAVDAPADGVNEAAVGVRKRRLRRVAFSMADRCTQSDGDGGRYGERSW